MRFIGLFFLIFALVFSTDCISLMQLGKPCPMVLHKPMKKQSVSKHHHPCHGQKQKNSEKETCGCQQKDSSQLFSYTHIDVKPEIAHVIFLLIQIQLNESVLETVQHFRIFKIPPNLYKYKSNLQSLQSIRLLI